MAVNLSFIGGAGWQFFDNNGDILSGGKIYTYIAGTTTPLATYTSRTGLTANTNPIVLDAYGRTPEQVWSTEELLYKYVVANSNDVVLRTWDNIGGSVVASNLAQDLAAPNGSSLVGFLQAGTGAVAITAQAKMREIVSVLDFYANGVSGVPVDPTGVVDSYLGIQAAINASDYVLVPEGLYKVTGNLTVTKPMTIRVEGTIQTTQYLYQVNPPTIFLVTSDDVIIEGSGILRGPGTFTHAIITDIEQIPSLIKVKSADNVTIRNLTFIDAPEAGLIYIDSDYIRIVGTTFIGGDTIANNKDIPNVAGINYWALYCYNSDYSFISGNSFLDDAAGNTFAEGIFMYGTNYSEISNNFFKNIVDHDVYMYHPAGTTAGVNNFNTLSNNRSYSTLIVTTEKIGSSLKVHGTFNNLFGNTIFNSNSGIVLEQGLGSIISGNVITGFNLFGVIVSDLVSTNADGLNYISITNNTLQANAAATDSYGIYFRGDATYTTANCVGGKITGNTIIRCGNTSGSITSPIALFHSNNSYFMDDFFVSDNVIVETKSLFSVFFDRVRQSKFAQNIIKNGTYIGWRGLRLNTYCTFNEITNNTVRDDQNTPLLLLGCDVASISDTDNIFFGNAFNSLYASRSTNPWNIDQLLRNTGDKNTNGDTLGYPVALSTAEDTVNVTASASVPLTMLVPTGARVVAAQIRVDSDLAGGDLWDAAYTVGLTGTIATAQAVAKNTKAGAIYNSFLASDVTTGSLVVAFTKNGGGSFTAQGSFRVLVYYESLTTLGNAA